MWSDAGSYRKRCISPPLVSANLLESFSMNEADFRVVWWDLHKMGGHRVPFLRPPRSLQRRPIGKKTAIAGSTLPTPPPSKMNFQLDGAPSGRLASHTPKRPRGLVFPKDVLQQVRSGISDIWADRGHLPKWATETPSRTMRVPCQVIQMRRATART